MDKFQTTRSGSTDLQLVGASAGGLEVLGQFFAQVPAVSGVADVAAPPQLQQETLEVLSTLVFV